MTLNLASSVNLQMSQIHFNSFIFLIISWTISANNTNELCSNSSDCKDVDCLSFSNCTRGYELDPCKCCKICLRGYKETCGGRLNLHGICLPGLTCVRHAPSNFIFNSSGSVGSCQPQVCEDTDEPKCQIDNIVCPADSYKLPLLYRNGFCCPLLEGCKCLPNQCERPVCAKGETPVMKAGGNGLPGSCCDTYECIPSNVFNCSQNGKIYVHGQKWNTTNGCSTCTCQYAVARCVEKRCPKVSGCNWSLTHDDPCCPQCGGCITSSGMIYNNSAVWKDDPCRICRCVDGKIYCMSVQCRPVTCQRGQKTNDDQCCPTCVDECDTVCPSGFKTDQHGNELCECKQQLPVERTSSDDHKKCLFGYDIDEKGCHVCRSKLYNNSTQKSCQKQCKYGYAKDVNGCLTCECIWEQNNFGLIMCVAIFFALIVICNHICKLRRQHKKRELILANRCDDSIDPMPLYRAYSADDHALQNVNA